MSTKNGSYQKGDYESLPTSEGGNGSSIVQGERPKKKGLVVGLIVLAVLAIIGIFYHSTHNAEAVVDKAIASSNTGLEVKANGKLKLFDQNSK